MKNYLVEFSPEDGIYLVDKFSPYAQIERNVHDFLYASELCHDHPIGAEITGDQLDHISGLYVVADRRLNLQKNEDEK